MSKNIKVIIQIIHGMSEHKERYNNFLKYFTEKNYFVFMQEHLYHENNVASKDK